jgi:myo-inositol-1(or 4)-monophosphatase
MSSQRSHDTHVRHLLNACTSAATQAAGYIRQHGEHLRDIDWRTKQRADFVSDVDTGAERLIRDVLTAAAPGMVMVGEELTPDARLDAETVFIVDPLDGTTNFLHGYPAYSVSIAALLEGRTVAGAVLNVAHDDLFTAVAGDGARRNGEAIRVSVLDQPERALIGTGFPFKHLDLLESYQRQFATLIRQSAGIRRAGSAALDLADVACGRFDAFWELRLAPWDMAAGLLLVREAGGMVTDLSGASIEPTHTAVVASNALLHPWMLRSLDVGSSTAPQSSPL